MSNRTTVDELQRQLSNPSDILSLLLLVGGDIVQKAIVQLIGYDVSRLIHSRADIPRFSIAPVALSFGCVAYSFSSVLAALGDKRMMPRPEFSSLVVNGSNAFVRETQSWTLSRLLRDHEIRHPVDSRSENEGGRAESIRIDIFHLEPHTKLKLDHVWWFGWAAICLQIVIAILPWIFYNNWGIMMVTLAGNLLSILSSALPQWAEEKWAGRRLLRDNVTCLTRGNGSPHVMVIIGQKGSWSIESMATATAVPRSETPWLTLLLAILWTCLLIIVSGLRRQAWFLIGIGSVGMLQNIHAAGSSRLPEASGFHLRRCSRAPVIIGKRQSYQNDISSATDLDKLEKTFADVTSWTSGQVTTPGPSGTDACTSNAALVSMPPWLSTLSKEDGVPSWLERAESSTANLTSKSSRHPVGIVYGSNIHGALIELEKWVPTAGLALVQIYFPSSLQYHSGSIRDNVHKKFWKKAYRTKDIRKAAEEKRRAASRTKRASLMTGNDRHATTVQV